MRRLFPRKQELLSDQGRHISADISGNSKCCRPSYFLKNFRKFSSGPISRTPSHAPSLCSKRIRAIAVRVV